MLFFCRKPALASLRRGVRLPVGSPHHPVYRKTLAVTDKRIILPDVLGIG